MDESSRVCDHSRTASFAVYTRKDRKYGWCFLLAPILFLGNFVTDFAFVASAASKCAPPSFAAKPDTAFVFGRRSPVIRAPPLPRRLFADRLAVGALDTSTASSSSSDQSSTKVHPPAVARSAGALGILRPVFSGERLRRNMGTSTDETSVGVSTSDGHNGAVQAIAAAGAMTGEERHLLAVADVFRLSIRSVEFGDAADGTRTGPREGSDCFSAGGRVLTEALREAAAVLNRLSLDATTSLESSDVVVDDAKSGDATGGGSDGECGDDSQDDPEEALLKLSRASQSASRSLCLLVERADSVATKGERRRTIPSGRAWKALQSVEGSAFGVGGVAGDGRSPPGEEARRLARALARLAMGIALAVGDDGADDAHARDQPSKLRRLSVSRMVASAILPSGKRREDCGNPKPADRERSDEAEERGAGKRRKRHKNDRRRAESAAADRETNGATGADASRKSGRLDDALARGALIGLLRRAVLVETGGDGRGDEPVSADNDGRKGGGVNDSTAAPPSIDLQVAAKIASAFEIDDDDAVGNSDSRRGTGAEGAGNAGAGRPTEHREELARAVDDAVRWALGWNHDARANAQIDQITVDDGARGELAASEKNDEHPSPPTPTKNDSIAPAFALAARVRPWKRDYSSPELLVSAAAELDLWYSAELVCDSVISSAAAAQRSPGGEVGTNDARPAGCNGDKNCSTLVAPSTRALIDATLNRQLFRLADGYATKYYALGGRARYAEARFLHARDTIDKVVRRRQCQIVERQVERVDEAVARVLLDGGEDPTTGAGTAENGHVGDGGVDEDGTKGGAANKHSSAATDAYATGSVDIREFSLRKLREANQHDAALRLAGLWGLPYEHSPAEIAAGVARNRETYLQWDDDKCPGGGGHGIACGIGEKEASPIPDLISDASDLINGFELLLRDKRRNIIGFDAEWVDGIRGVSVLQLSTISHALLLDIPTLTSTKVGSEALEATVGKLFSSGVLFRNVVGFGCKEDLSRLRATSSLLGGGGHDETQRAAHWFPSNHTVAQDLRSLISESNPSLGKRNFGLSRACELYLGKPLDKAEQCSDWSTRPLSLKQRGYAALDAWACAAIFEAIVPAKD